MNRDYSEYQKDMSPEQRKRYNRWKDKGDRGEDRAFQLLKAKGYNVRPSTVEEDLKHADFINIDTGETIDVKNKYCFALELENYNGNPGWLFTGADWIIQCFENSSYWGNDVYMYKRSDMFHYYMTRQGLFRREFCKRGPGKSIIWILGKKRLAEMKFMIKLN